MNTDKAKKFVSSLIGKEVKIKVNVGRNKHEYYEGEVIGMYPYLFTVKVDNLMKSFSYVDLITKDVQFKIKND